jgi:hypothetical protein
MVQVTHRHGPADDPSTGRQQAAPVGYLTDFTISTEKASWPLLLMVGALCVALALVVARFALHDRNSATLDSGSTTSKTLPPRHDKAEEHTGNGGRHTSLPNTRRASGEGWTMQVPRRWTAVDIPNVDEQAAWRTPGGLPGVGDMVTIVDEDMGSLNLHQYMKYQRNALRVGISTASHIRTSVSHGRGELTYYMIANGKQAWTLQVVVPTTSGFASAILVAPPETYSQDVKQVRRYLETFTGR